MLPVEHPTPAAAKMGRDRLRRRCERLLRLLDLKAPEVVLANEVLMIQEAAALALGRHLYAAACRRDVERLRFGAGLCEDCDEPVFRNGLCMEHDRQAKEPAGEDGDGEGRLF